MEIEAKEKDKEEEKAKETKEGNDEKAKDQPAKRSFDPSASKLIGLFVISDIVNAAGTSGVRHSWRYPQLYDNALRAHNVFEHLGRLEKELGFGRISAGKWKQSLRNLLDHWEFLNCFVNLEHFKQVLEKPPTESKPAPKPKETAAFTKSKSRWKTVDEESMSDVDGVLKGDSDFEEAVEEQTNTRQRKQRPKAEDMFPSDS
jgi:U2-associated protein SR140